MMGVRNIPRRTAQTVLIVIGLMLSTLIISAAFAPATRVDHSITKQAYTLLGHVDETVQGDRANDLDDPKLEGENGIDITADQYSGFPGGRCHQRTARTLMARLGSSSKSSL